MNGLGQNFDDFMIEQSLYDAAKELAEKKLIVLKQEMEAQKLSKSNVAEKGGVFTRQRDLLDVLDQVSADGIITRALSTQKMPAEIIGEMVREKIAASV